MRRRILQASRVPEFALFSKRAILNGQGAPPDQLQRALNYAYITPSNRSKVQDLLAKVQEGHVLQHALPWSISLLATALI